MLQNEINRKDEAIERLKIGLSGIVKQYDYKNVQDFYRIYHKTEDVWAADQKEAASREESYGEEKTVRSEKESVSGND